MNPFQVGDRVRVIDSPGDGELLNGSVHTVNAVDGDLICVRRDCSMCLPDKIRGHGWYMRRFEMVELTDNEMRLAAGGFLELRSRL